MKVGELIELLEQFDAKTPVHFAYNYGDHWSTQVAPEVEEVDQGHVVHSPYHNMPKVYDGEDDDGKDTTPVIILS